MVPGDYPILYQYATTGRAALSWRLRGRSISPDAFPNVLWNDCLAQYVIAPRASQWSVCGVISAFNHDPVGDTAYLSVLLAPEAASTSTALGEALLLFVPYLSHAFGLRKLYAETTEYSLPGLDTLPERFTSVRVEGRLAEHSRIAGGLVDLVILTIDIDAFADDYARLSRLFNSEPQRSVRGTVPYEDFEVALRDHLRPTPVEPILAGTSLTDELRIDSLGLLEVICMLEDRFGVSLPDDAIPALHNVQDLYAAIEAARHEVDSADFATVV